MSGSLASLQFDTVWPASQPEEPRPQHIGEADALAHAADHNVCVAELCPAFLLALEDRLRGVEDAAELVRTACSMVAAHVGVTQVLLLGLDGEGRCIPAAERGERQPNAIETGLSLADFGTTKEQLEGSYSVKVGDVRLDPRLASAAIQASWAARQVLSLAAVPVIENGRASALFLAANRHPIVWRETDLKLLRSASARTWRALARAWAQTDLKRSEHEHRMAVELCSQRFYTATLDGDVVGTGYSLGQFRMLGSDQPTFDWRCTTHPEDLPMVEQRIEHCLRTGECYDVEYRVCGKDGHMRWVHVQNRPMREADGAVVRWFGTITDISRRKSTEAALKASEDRFVRALAGARVGTWELDVDKDILETSPGYVSTFFGRPDGSIRSSADFEALLHPDDRAAPAIEFARVVDQARLSGHADYQAEFRTILPNGDVRWLGSVGRYTADPVTGRNARLCGVLVDMSERRRAELELNTTQKRLRELNAGLEAQVRREVGAREQAQAQLAQSQRLEALGQLAGGIAHDFNNVLQAVLGGLDLLARRADRPDKVRELAVRTGNAVARGVAITGRLLSFARRGELHAQQVEARSLLESLRDLLVPTLGVNIALRVESEPGLQAFLADRAQLETVIVNLAVNARHAMPHGGSLTIEAHQTVVQSGAPLQPGVPPGLKAGSYVRISVQDNGTGMTPEVLARACDPFFTTKPMGQGTGLGLAMARGFAEQSGGGLMLFSQPGQGTMVSLWLPVVQVAQAAGLAILPAKVEFAGRSPCVLMVDDDGLVRSTLAALLVDLECTVIEAESGAAALAYLRAGAPVDLVVTDYAMPGLNGAALAAVIRQNYPGLPLLLVTGNVDASLRINTVGWNPAHIMVLRKPLSASTLAHAVASLLGTCPPSQIEKHSSGLQ